MCKMFVRDTQSPFVMCCSFLIYSIYSLALTRQGTISFPRVKLFVIFFLCETRHGKVLHPCQGAYLIPFLSPITPIVCIHLAAAAGSYWLNTIIPLLDFLPIICTGSYIGSINPTELQLGNQQCQWVSASLISKWNVAQKQHFSDPVNLSYFPAF